MSVQCERQSQCDKQQQEYEFVMEGITTRMQIALEKMADSNRMMSETNKRLCIALRTMCIMMIVVVFIVSIGFIIDHQLCKRNEGQTTSSGVSAYETVLEQRPGADD